MYQHFLQEKILHVQNDLKDGGNHNIPQRSTKQLLCNVIQNNHTYSKLTKQLKKIPVHKNTEKDEQCKVSTEMAVKKNHCHSSDIF